MEPNLLIIRLKEFCNINGIIFEPTIPNNAQQNGRVESFHGTLLPSARAMLEDPYLNHMFWEDVITTANYLHNRILHKSNNNNIRNYYDPSIYGQYNYNTPNYYLPYYIYNNINKNFLLMF